MEKLSEQISFDALDIEDKQICIDAEYVDEQLAEIAQNQDLSRYILKSNFHLSNLIYLSRFPR